MRIRLPSIVFGVAVLVTAVPGLGASASETSQTAPTGAPGVGPAEKPAETDGGVCREQIERYVTEQLDQTVIEIDFNYVFGQRSAGGEGDGLASAAVVYVQECPGFHVFDLFAADYDCESKFHHGTVPNYIRYRSANQGC